MPKRAKTGRPKVDVSFNFGANARPKRTRKAKKTSGKKSNAWTAYVGTQKR